MAIMRTCCCCGVRTGSIACGIYSVIVAVLGAVVFVFDLISIPSIKQTLLDFQELYPDVLGDLNIDTYICTLKASYIIAFIFLVSMFFTSIVLMVGIHKDSKGMLIPFMVSKGVGFLWYIYSFCVSMYAIAQMGMQYAEVSVLFFLIMLGPFVAADIVCLLCVISQYQEYRDGRGRLCDNVGQGHSTVIVQQEMTSTTATGGYAYRPVKQELPPPYDQTTAIQKSAPHNV